MSTRQCWEPGSKSECFIVPWTLQIETVTIAHDFSDPKSGQGFHLSLCREMLGPGSAGLCWTLNGSLSVSYGCSSSSVLIGKQSPELTQFWKWTSIYLCIKGPYKLFATTGRYSRYEASFTFSCANGAKQTQNVSDLWGVPLLSAPATTSDNSWKRKKYGALWRHRYLL